jgi:hypothetical protein
VSKTDKFAFLKIAHDYPPHHVLTLVCRSWPKIYLAGDKSAARCKEYKKTAERRVGKRWRKNLTGRGRRRRILTGTNCKNTGKRLRENWAWNCRSGKKGPVRKRIEIPLPLLLLKMILHYIKLHKAISPAPAWRREIFLFADHGSGFKPYRYSSV